MNLLWDLIARRFGQRTMFWMVVPLTVFCGLWLAGWALVQALR